jgi:hypothetical protein
MFKHPRRLLFCAAALALAAVACTAAQSFELARVQKADVRVLPGAEGFKHPFTGIVSYTPQEWQTRPALGIKVGNSANERPQAGLDRADVIFEEIVEGGVTRFLAVYSTNQAPRVGPVRSVRTVDHKIMRPISGLFGYSGGVPPVVSELQETPGITDVGANRASDAYRRDSSRSMPYNLYTSTDQLWQGRAGEVPGPQFEFLSTADDPSAGGEVANEVKFSFAGNSSEIRFEYDEETGHYERYMGVGAHMVEGDGEGVQLAFRNVLIQTVNTVTGTTTDKAGFSSTDIHMIGDGAAVLFRGGRAFRGRWERSDVTQSTRFIGNDGQALRLAPGETMIELLPEGQDLSVT